LQHEDALPDNLSPEDRLRTMRAVTSQKTGPERRLRALLAGLRIKGWVVNPKNIPGNPDFAFPHQKLAIFVDGCFWHGCPECQRPLPVNNHAYWARKIQRNIERDKLNTAALLAGGWRVLRIWEHRLKKKTGLAPVSKDLREFINSG
jgi:DNA mismatch endonuclease Vsr